MRKFLLSLVLFAMATVTLNHSNLLAMEVEETISVGEYPTTIVFSQSGATAYVSNWADGTISLIDTARKEEILPRITCASDNHAKVAVTKDASYLYMTNYYGGTVVKVRLSDLTCVSSISVGPWPNGCWLSPADDNLLYVRVNCPYSGANGWVAEIDTTTETVTRTFPMQIAGNIALSSDGRYLYLPSYYTPSMYKVDLSSGISLTIPLPNRAWDIVLSDDDKTLCISNSLDESIYVISTETDEVIDTIPLAISGMDITPNGEFLYVSLPLSEEVAKVSTSTSESGDPIIVDRITIAGSSVGLGVALSPDQNYLYVSNIEEDTVTIIAKLNPVVAIDIKPGSCPNPLGLKKKGALPVAILGSEDFDVSDVDVVSVRLEGVPPLRSAYEDVATPLYPLIGKVDCLYDCTNERKDGYLDLTLKFNAQEVIAAVIEKFGDLEHKDCLVLTITGNLYDSTPIEGEDVVSIREE